MSDYVQKIVLKAVDEVSATQKKILKETKKTFDSIKTQSIQSEKSVKSVGNSFLNLKTIGAGVAAFFTNQFIQSLVDTEQQIQRVERSLKVATGTTKGAASEIEFLKNQSERLGLEFKTVALSYGQLAAATKDTALTTDQTREIFLATAEAGSALGLSASDMEGALRAMQQMISKGNVQAEELRGQLGERIPGAFNMAAKAMGVSTKQLNKLLETGKVTADEMLPSLAKEMRNTFGSQAAEGAEQMTGQINRLKNALFETRQAILESGLSDILLITFNKLTQSIKDISNAFSVMKGAVFGFKEADLSTFTKTQREELESLIERQKNATKSLQLLTEAQKKQREELSFLEKINIKTNESYNKLSFSVLKAKVNLEDVNRQLERIIGSDTDIESVVEKISKLNDAEISQTRKVKTKVELSGSNDVKVGISATDIMEAEKSKLEVERNALQERLDLNFQISEMMLQAQQDSQEKELALLDLHYEQKRNIEISNEEDKKDYLKALELNHQKEQDAIKEQYAQRDIQRQKDISASHVQAVNNILQAGKVLTNGNKKMEWLNKGFTATQVLLNSYLAASTALMLPPAGLGPVAGIPLALSIGALGVANAAKVMAAAKGADFTTSGPQLLLVGDNPGGRERVQVTPESSPNINGPKNETMNVNFGNMSINLQQNVFDQIENNPEEFGRAFSRAMKRGALEGVG